MSFGFSVGDFLAVGKLIKDITSCLRETGGAQSQYRDLMRELESLQQVLEHLDRLQTSGNSLNLDSIKYSALSCRVPLEDFLEKIRKRYDKSLGVWGRPGILKNTSKKLRWGLGGGEEIARLQSYLTLHVGTINILLLQHGFEKMDMASDQATTDQLDIQKRLEDTRSVVEKVSGSMIAQTRVVEKSQHMLAQLYQMVSGEFMASLRSLGEMVAKVW
jgi:hypothetical protein